jgi:hypothetical protein
MAGNRQAGTSRPKNGEIPSCLGLNMLDDVVPVAAGEGAVEAAPVRPHPLVFGVNLGVQHGLQEGGGWTQGGDTRRKKRSERDPRGWPLRFY